MTGWPLQRVLAALPLRPASPGGPVTELAALGQLDNTYIIYTSDNGFHLGSFGMGTVSAPAVYRRWRATQATCTTCTCTPTCRSTHAPTGLSRSSVRAHCAAPRRTPDAATETYSQAFMWTTPDGRLFEMKLCCTAAGSHTHAQGKGKPIDEDMHVPFDMP